MPSPESTAGDPDCIFCAIVAGRQQAHTVYEDDRVLAFLDIRPVSAGHTLVIPKTHVRDIYSLDDADAEAVMRAAAHVARALKSSLQPDGINLLQSNERAAGQVVFHLHVHVIPRAYGDGLVTPRQAARHSDAPLGEVADRIRTALS